MFFENFKIALRAIWANKLRSILTVLGVMIGVAAVIAVVSLVQGMQKKISGDLSEIGSNFLEVYPDPGEERNPFLQKMPDLTIEDAEAVRRGTPAIGHFTPFFIRNAQTRNGSIRHTAQMYGVNDSYQEVVNHWVDRGRFFTALDLEAKKRVTVIGPQVARKLRLGDDALGKSIQIDNNGYTVVGVLEKKGGSFGQDRDDLLLIPLTTAAAIYGADNMKKLVIAFQLRDGSDIDLAREQITDILRTRHRLKKGERDDFR
ncbi:MAG TPA: ABC transporter permease, partial [Thermoanaerobaculia bacterium]|nr:ABC transporter permease [Thermoanaerobaculia bacterium]